MIYKKGLMYTGIPAISAAKKGKLLSASPFIIHAFLFLKKLNAYYFFLLR